MSSYYDQLLTNFKERPSELAALRRIESILAPEECEQLHCCGRCWIRKRVGRNEHFLLFPTALGLKAVVCSRIGTLTILRGGCFQWRHGKVHWQDAPNELPFFDTYLALILFFISEPATTFRGRIMGRQLDLKSLAGDGQLPPLPPARPKKSRRKQEICLLC